jgi:hypothetical protein
VSYGDALLMTAVLGRHYSNGYLTVAGVMAALAIVFLVTVSQWGRASDTGRKSMQTSFGLAVPSRFWF